MELFITIIATFFSVLGALALFFEVSDRILSHKKKGKTDTKRRSLIALGVSLTLGIIWGVASNISNERKNKALKLLTEIETRLLQIEGLVTASMYGDKAGVSQEVLRQLAIDTYSYRLRLNEADSDCPPDVLCSKSLDPLKTDQQNDIESKLDKVRKVIDSAFKDSDQDHQPNYIELLRVIEQAKTTVRNYIHEYR